ncbi:hypothetical protein VNN41_09850 [Lactococcus garvieae]|uniref:hypothetical protein n=1 Tax=Lactococcus garvieae TaxID=1363 RepID=UPI0032530DE6
MKELTLEIINYTCTATISIISISSGILMSKSAMKAPQVIGTSKILLEEVFSFGLEHIENKLYKPLTLSIQKDLRDFQKHSRKYHIYFDREFVQLLNEICTAKSSDDATLQKNHQADYNNFSYYYFKALKTSRKNLGLTRYSYDFRIKNDLYTNPKTRKTLEITDKILLGLFLLCAFIFILSFAMFPSYSVVFFSLTFLMFYILLLFHHFMSY